MFETILAKSTRNGKVQFPRSLHFSWNSFLDSIIYDIVLRRFSTALFLSKEISKNFMGTSTSRPGRGKSQRGFRVHCCSCLVAMGMNRSSLSEKRWSFVLISCSIVSLHSLLRSKPSVQSPSRSLFNCSSCSPAEQVVSMPSSFLQFPFFAQKIHF